MLFLRNDPSQEVEVHEVKQVDFHTVQERLANGETVFITSNNTQKLKAEPNSARLSVKTRVITAFKLEP